MNPPASIGILLAAGSGKRFGGDKLLARLATGDLAGEAVGVAACRHLLAAVGHVIAVVRPDDAALAAALGAAGARIVRCADAADGMGASLACGVAASMTAGRWIVALADMPWIRPATIAEVRAALVAGARIAAPQFRGQRGHPVGFSADYRDQLAALTGDEGARAVIAAHAEDLTLLPVDDPGVVRDIDTPADLVPE
jgi:molybdenum cofactor cytidylyltransferase